MSSRDITFAAAGAAAAAAPEYVDDVFSTYLYTGNGSTQTITNGIDLAGEGGLVWTKRRNASSDHFLLDTARDGELNTNNTEAAGNTGASNYISAYNSDGYTIASGTPMTTANPFCSWTFRKAPKFFDVVTYTGNGVAFRTGIPHNLGSTPGMIIVKRIDSTSDWKVWHRSLGFSNSALLNSSAAANSDTASSGDARYQGYIYSANSTTFTTDAGSGDNVTQINASGGTYVAYLFAHNAGGFGEAGTDNVISCGTFTTNASGVASVNLGYEPQYVLVKTTGIAGSWIINDSMRGMTVNENSINLYANLSAQEFSNDAIYPNATGFSTSLIATSATHIYMAIRRPMKPPTSGTEVFSPTVYTGTNADNRLINTSLLTDMVMIKERNDTVAGMRVGDRLQGNPYLTTGTTAAEVNDADSLMTPTASYGNAFSAMNGVGVGNDATAKVNIDTTSNNHIAWAFKRASGFMDIVCYTGTGSATTVAHNLGVAPELMIVKRRSATGLWAVQSSTLGNTKYLQLNTTDPEGTSTTLWNNTSPTASVFTVNTSSAVNASGSTYVAYLFASVAGVSKVGSYTGNGSSQTINCGFTAGARFVLIKRTDDTGSWYVWDTARGIVSANDPYVILNTATAEVVNSDVVDPESSGFAVNQTAVGLNVSSATYIFLAIA